MIARTARKEVEAALSDAPAMMRIKEAAAFARMHERTVRRALSDGRLAGIRKSARAYLVPKASLIAFLCGGVS